MACKNEKQTPVANKGTKTKAHKTEGNKNRGKAKTRKQQ